MGVDKELADGVLALMNNAYEAGKQSALKIEPREKWAESWNTDIVDVIECIKDLAVGALLTDGEHHKQWYLERILQGLGIDLSQLRKSLQADDYDWDAGIAP